MADFPTTRYFDFSRQRPDRAIILNEWIVRTFTAPEVTATQADGRIRCWKRIPEAGGKTLRVILLEDGRTVHNAFFDRTFIAPDA